MRIILRIEYSFLTLFSGECEYDGIKSKGIRNPMFSEDAKNIKSGKIRGR